MKVLVVSPHPDDESIGCGGVLRKHFVDGDDIDIIFLTSGEAGGHGLGLEETRSIREREAVAAARIIGVHRLEFWRQKDGALRASNNLIRKLNAVLKRDMPDVVYVPHIEESHTDHRASARIVRSAVTLLDGFKPTVRMFEVWSPLSVLDEVIDITPYIEVKLAAIAAYESQCKVLRFDEAMRGLARYRSEMHCWPKPEEAVCTYAEAFRELKA